MLMTKCKMCHLCLSRKRVTKSSRLDLLGKHGSPKVIFITANPVDIDEIMGRIYNGPKRKTLEELFKGCELESVTVIPLVRCIPRKSRKEDIRFPNETELLKCTKWLHYEIEYINPDVIVADGKEVFQVLKKEYPDTLSVPDVSFIHDQGGVGAPYFPMTKQLIKDKISNA